MLLIKILKKKEELKMQVVMINYKPKKDYLIPELEIMENQVRVNGKYAIARENFLRTHRPSKFDMMIMQETLIPHLNEVQQECEKQLKIRMQQKIKRDNLTEQMKEQNQQEWWQLMNMIKMEVDSEIMRELVLV